MQESPLFRRVLTRLETAEVRELNPHFQTDIRIAWVTVLFAWNGVLEPHVAATVAILGLHPAKVWRAIIARRKALLGRDYSLFYDAAGNWIAEPLADPLVGESPRKPVQSAKLEPPPELDKAA